MNLPTRQRGQAMTEYSIVLGLTVIVLILSSLDESPIQTLLDGLKSAFTAFSYVMSFST
ncbi:MAG TPA: hypothetical protein VFS95_03740 [Telluria sp.]|nr:hypothetical protein [Telluria sp.]